MSLHSKSRIAPVLALTCLITGASGQDVHYDYDRDANFAAFKSYQWVDLQGAAEDQLKDQNIKKAIDEQLALKGLTKVEKGADLYVGYKIGASQEKNVTFWDTGPRWRGGMAQGQTSTVTVGTLVVSIYDPARKQLVWRGDATKTLQPSKNPDENYKRLQKAVAKLFKNYPPPVKQ